ncbi:MAG: threonine--tRNA ligase [Candidatus Thermoplasmatota archaeon]|nr:threonine--tRNA ligase [Candidatus Thermoplasmatota archaeon]
MKILLIHSDYLRYEVKKDTPVAEEIEEEMKEGEMEECLSVFTAVEEKDEGKVDKVVELGIEEITDTAEKLDVAKIMIYPYAHLSSDLGDPDTAVEVLEGLEEGLIEDYEVHRSPFGWYKAFQLSCKGHPLSELSKEIIVEEEEKEVISKALKAEETLESTWGVLEEDGTFHELDIEGDEVTGYDFKGKEKLKDFAIYEAGKKEKGGIESAHIDLMRKHEMVDYEPGSDPGNLRYYPKGRMVKGLLENFVSQKTREYGAMEIESPVMYDMDHPTLKKYLDRFPERQYQIETPDKDVFLRFAACFGQFLMGHDMTISYRQLPIRLYELTRYSFRMEQRGELSGLRRLRAFTMPDSHALCQDIDQSKDEMMTRMDLATRVLNDVGINVPHGLELGIRCTKDFFEENKDHLVETVKNYGKPALVEIWDERFFYYVFKYEFNYIDRSGRASALVTDQLDVENAERYGITYVDEDGNEKHPYLLHLSPSGAIERVMFTLLENAALQEEKGEKPEFPYWLAPTQLRFVPISDDQLDYVGELAEEFEDVEVRVDIDDTDRTVGKKIRAAEKEWIPYVVVIGPDEIESGKLSVRIRGEEKQKTMALEELKSELEERQGDMLFRDLPLPKMVSKRPLFVG